MALNLKSESAMKRGGLNSKQIQISKFKCSKRGFVFLSFGIKNCLGFRILGLGFPQAVARG